MIVTKAARIKVKIMVPPDIWMMTLAAFIPRPVIDSPPITRPAAAQAPATGRIRSVVSPSA